MNKCCQKTYKDAFNEVIILLESDLKNLSIEAVVTALKFAVMELEKKNER